MLRLGIRRDGLAMDVVSRSLEMIDSLVATEGRVARICRPGVFRLFHFLRLRDIVFVLIIRVGRIVQASVGGRSPAKLGIARASAKIRSLAHAERRVAPSVPIPITRGQCRSGQAEAANNRETQRLF